MGLWLSLLNHLTEMSYNAQDDSTALLMLGLDDSGKTTCLYRLKFNETVRTIPTIGFNVETVRPVPGRSFTLWDVGGQEKIRPLWPHYYNFISGIIFVVDSANRAKFDEVRRELFQVLRDPEMIRNTPLLVLANKQDLTDACDISEITEALQLNSLTDTPWHIQGACGITGEGLCEGFQHISQMIREYRSRGGR